MNFIQVQHFMSIMKHMSLTKAAKELYITQPALSHSLSKMEQELGIPLFYRDNNRLVITRECSEIFGDLYDLYEVYETMMKHARELKLNQQKKIRLGFFGSVVTFSSLFFHGILTSYNNIPIEKMFADYDQVKLMLENETLDLAITFPPIQGGGKLITKIIARDEIVVVMNRIHPLMKKSAVTREDLEKYTFEILTEPNPYRKYMDQLLKEENISLKMNEHDYDDYLKVFQENEFVKPVIALSPLRRVRQWYGEGYQVRKIEDVKLELVTGLSWNSSSDIPYKYQDLTRQIEKYYAGMDGVDIDEGLLFQ